MLDAICDESVIHLIYTWVDFNEEYLSRINVFFGESKSTFTLPPCGRLVPTNLGRHWVGRIHGR